ncbi:uncharacterized protein K452DRAFT_311562 [Aplosporella prunicola CBS 121167]|uniref:Transcription factor domain-containing protein n=1 Tax=Aplosporella prunicola CBS 121167 TaxID=1176127 RepID=A0A6A6B2A5_9PEZI|nr:uncharacterized protein K452DRAFT_311562 [Aplosporella prunicola CBS 121167]KAF2138190.1 hypothetical protein K452DRAFT_311562 [Aplosporella prunicola CBS 121167]
MYRQPKKRAENLKCMFCRRDKRKCIPTRRRSAKDEKRVLREIRQETTGVISDAAPSTLRQIDHEEESTEELDRGVVTLESIVEPVDDVFDNTSQIPLERTRQSTSSSHAVTLRVQPRSGRQWNNVTFRLNERLRHLWASPDTYKNVCSSRFGTTLSDLFFYDFRQIANALLQEDMVYNALYAFSAADSAVNAEFDTRINFEVEARMFFQEASRLLRENLTEIIESSESNRRVNIMPAFYTIFLLAAYAVRKICANEPNILESMASMISFLRQRSAVFPLSLRYSCLEPTGWRFQIFLADDIEDTGLICGHDTTIFDSARHEFEQTVTEFPRVVEIPQENSD